MQFKELGLSDELLSAVKSMGFDEMTEIQEKSIPVIMKGLDIIGRSNTGTGKTAAFGIPVIEKILQNACKCKNVSVSEVVSAVKNGADTFEKVAETTGAGTACGRCKEIILNIIENKR